MAQVLMLTSGKGGTGKSSLTVLLGRELALRGKDVLLLELDNGLRSLDILLGVSDRVLFDIGDVLSGRCKPVKAITVVPTPAGNLHYVAAAASSGAVLDRAEIERFITGLRPLYDYILIDMAAGLGGELPVVAELCDRALIVTHASPVPVRDAASLAALLRRWGCDDIRLVINHFHAGQIGPVPDLDWVIDTAAVQLIGVVPSDPTLPTALASGRALHERAPARLAASAIAARIEGQYLPLLPTSLK